MTLDEFMAQSRQRNAYVEYPGFAALYIRKGHFRFIECVKWPLVLDLANMEAVKTGQGTFKRLVAHLRERYPEYGLYVECVLTSRFAKGLERMGFVRMDKGALSPAYWLPPVVSSTGA